MDLCQETFTYASSFDGTQPLHADVAFLPDDRRKPLLVVMHGYSGSRKAVAADLSAFASQGVFAVAPDMRGVGGSAGLFDSGGLEIHDILDAVLACLQKYAAEIDPINLNICGYSGGGGNALFAAARFPELFQTATSFFGITDYAAWHRSNGRVDCNQRMENALGGPPRDRPQQFEARNVNPAAGNILAALHLFWDEEETQCPPEPMITDFVASYRAFRHAHNAEERLALHVSKKGAAIRWQHGYRGDNPMLNHADPLFLADVLKPKLLAPPHPLTLTLSPEKRCASKTRRWRGRVWQLVEAPNSPGIFRRLFSAAPQHVEITATC